MDLSNWNLAIMIILLLGLVIFAVLAVMIRSLLKASIALAITSAVLTVAMFMMKAALAAVFELSVCAGLITVVFISAISMTRPSTDEEVMAERKERIRRFMYLPFVLAAVCILLLWFAWTSNFDFSRFFNQFIKTTASVSTVQEVLWNTRQLDVLGQVIIILAGVFGVVVLFKEREVK